MTIIREVTIGDCRLIQGDSLEVLPSIERVDAVVTSPPYAMQRKDLYGGIAEHRYPVWTANWMMALETACHSETSILINIREHLRSGEISDYVHKTRMLLRDIGFVECEEVIWCKPDSPPVGSIKRPRRAWERVLWFGLTGEAYCDTKANGQPSDRIGLTADSAGAASAGWINGMGALKSGIARSRDYCEIGTGSNDASVDHPAKYPTEFAEWMIRGWCNPGGCVCDPFMGSGTTGIAAVKHGRSFIGIEREPKYFDIAVRRIEQAYADQALFAGAAQ